MFFIFALINVFFEIFVFYAGVITAVYLQHFWRRKAYWCARGVIG